MRFQFLSLTFLVLMATPGAVVSQEDAAKDYSAYLLVYFKDDTHSLHMALSADGYRFTDVNAGKPVVDGQDIALQKGIRDPHITRGPDGSFYLASTDLHIFAKREGLRDTEWERPGDQFGWGNNRALVFSKSDDLIHWTHANVRVDEAFPGLEDIGAAWAPELIWDDHEGRMMVYFTMRHRNGINRLYYSYANEDFTGLATEPKLLFEYPKPGTSYIDGDITKVGDRFHLFYVPHDDTRGIKQAVSEALTGEYQYLDEYLDPEHAACEAPNVWRRLGTDTYVLMYDVYGTQPHNFGFCETTDFKTFTPIGRFNDGVMKATNFSSPKHGAVTYLTNDEARRLAEHYNLAWPPSQAGGPATQSMR